MKYKFLAVVTLFLASLSAYADLKVGFVQVDKILQEAPQTIESNKKLEKEFSARSDKLKEDVKALKFSENEALSYVTQTTLSVDETRDIIDALRACFPAINGPAKDDICYATQNRQDAVRQLSEQVDLLIVVGSKNSSNSNRLRELAQKTGTQAYLVDTAADVEPSWFKGVTKVAVTAGASAPEVLVQQVVNAIAEHAPSVITEVEGRKEDIVFAVPAELR